MPGADWYKKIDEIREAGGFAGRSETILFGNSGYADYNVLQDAIDAARDWLGDVILVEQTEDGAYGVPELVTLDCPGLTLKAANIGMIPEARGENATFRGTAAVYVDGPTIKVTKPCHIQGLGFTTRNVTSGDADSAGLVIDCEEQGGYPGGFNWIEECRFSCWYGSQSYGIYTIGGTVNRIEKCTFDGLFVGFGIAAIGMANDTGGLAPCFSRVERNYFQGLGSSIPAVKFVTGAVPLDFVMAHNYNTAGYGTRGVLLDNNSVVSSGMVVDNWTGLANKATAFLNLTNSNLSFCGNHYEEA